MEVLVSRAWVLCIKRSTSRSNLNSNMLVFVKGGKPENPEKNSRSKDRTNNKLNPHETAITRIKSVVRCGIAEKFKILICISLPNKRYYCLIPRSIKYFSQLSAILHLTLRIRLTEAGGEHLSTAPIVLSPFKSLYIFFQCALLVCPTCEIVECMFW